MKNKLIFRILGALASALIIVSVFVPFVSVTGYSPSLWETYKLTNALYLPIMIIVFGAIGVIFFALNIKTEFAYMSVGAIIFFLVIRTIDILNQGAFSSLSVGYYFLVVGALLTGIVAFLTNLKSKNKISVSQEEKKVEETSMLDQIDKLYNDQTNNQTEISPIQPLDNAIQPLPVQPLEQKTIEEMPVNPIIQEVIPQPFGVTQETIVEQIQVENKEQPVNPVLQEFNVPMVEETQNIQEQPVLEPTANQSVNPVLQEFNVPMAEESQNIQEQPVLEPTVNQPVNPVLQEFNVPIVEETQSIQEQPVLEPTVNQPVNPVLQEFAQQVNPVVQEFGIAPKNTVEQTSMVQEQPTINQEIASVPLVNINEPVPSNPVIEDFNNQGSIISSPQQNPNELDIFGQPINKS